MILLTLLITFLLKINFISCQVLGTPLKTGYDETFAKYLFLLTSDSYSQYPGKCIPQLVSYFKSYVFVKNFKSICDRNGNTCSFFLLANENSKTLILVFSGAQGLSQVFHIARSMTKKIKNFFDMGDVNEYFLRAHISLWKHLENIIKNPLYGNYKFIVTGHSFGGALAALAAFRIQITKIKQSKDIVLYTFGEPRVGTLLFATYFDQNVPQSYRIVNSLDFIAHLPPCKKEKLRNSRYSFKKKSLPCSRKDINGYYHHGIEIWYPRTPHLRNAFFECLDAPKNEDIKCSDRSTFKAHEYKTLRSDHSSYFPEIQLNYLHIINKKYNRDCSLFSRNRK